VMTFIGKTTKKREAEYNWLPNTNVQFSALCNELPFSVHIVGLAARDTVSNEILLRILGLGRPHLHLASQAFSASHFLTYQNYQLNLPFIFAGVQIKELGENTLSLINRITPDLELEKHGVWIRVKPMQFRTFSIEFSNQEKIGNTDGCPTHPPYKVTKSLSFENFNQQKEDKEISQIISGPTLEKQSGLIWILGGAVVIGCVVFYFSKSRKARKVWHVLDMKNH